jgi:hypothetical protein
MAVRARAARTGTYAYLGSEIDPDNKHGLRDAGVVNVLRDDKTVFDEASARSFIGKPVTDDHPSAPVNATNWRDYARGMIMGAMRDGDYLAFDLLLTDAEAIKKIGDGKRELSNGYAADLEFGDFEAADGTKCVARQASISGNHVALVDKGRAGSECAIADAATCDSATAEIAKLLLDQILTDERTYSGSRDGHTNNPTNVVRQSGDIQMPHTLIIDGLQVTEVSDQAKAAIEKLQGQVKLTADKDAAEAEVGELTATALHRQGRRDRHARAAGQGRQVTPAAAARSGSGDRRRSSPGEEARSGASLNDGKTEAAIRKRGCERQARRRGEGLDDAQIAVSIRRPRPRTRRSETA